ncbi:hypothetical protein [Haloimpatiens massiliensis]|uniref:DUF7852 domain-containing protein n=1 Tax=Haloimpatiens massiliensis TaxID=1658110 RepID=UPI000C85DD99|nr:hypothetical protein [Haloimpatiens massiliensis]
MLTILILIEIIYLINKRFYYSYIYYALMYFCINSIKISNSSKNSSISNTPTRTSGICDDACDMRNNTANSEKSTHNVTNNVPNNTSNSSNFTSNETNINKYTNNNLTDNLSNDNNSDNDNLTNNIPNNNNPDNDNLNNNILNNNNINNDNVTNNLLNNISSTNNDLPISNEPYHNVTNTINTNCCTTMPRTLCNVPIILGEYILDIPLEHSLQFEEKVLKIRTIKNLIGITEYHILCENKINSSNFSTDYINNSQIKCNIFINGVLTRNIEYSSCEDINNSFIKTSVKELIKAIPFKTVFCVKFPYYLLKDNAKINLHLKKAHIEDINYSSKTELISEAVNLPLLSDLYLIKELQSKILLKLQIDLIINRQVYI